MGTAAPFVLVAMAAVSAGASVMGARAGMQAAEVEKQGYKNEREASRVQALDEEAQRRVHLNKVLSLQRAQASAMGHDVERAGTFRALEREEKYQAATDIKNIKLMAKYRNAAANAGMAQAHLKKKAAIWEGVNGLARAGMSAYGGFKAAAPGGGTTAYTPSNANTSTIGTGAR
jgi:hypothetical protein